MSKFIESSIHFTLVLSLMALILFALGWAVVGLMAFLAMILMGLVPFVAVVLPLYLVWALSGSVVEYFRAKK